MNTETPLKIYSHSYRLIAAQCNAQRELAPAALIQQIIEVATEHADLLGIGFKRLQDDGNLWVLSRITVELKRYPKLLEEYTLSTWVEGYNRHFSERNFEITGADGEILGYARTVWVAIDMRTRRPADMSGLASLAVTVCDKPCPIAKQGKIRPIDPPQTVHNYTFRVSDIDFNRHVNSARYVELILNQMDLSTFDDYYLARFEIEYKHETHFDDEVEVCSAFADEALISAIVKDDTTVCVARSFMEPRTKPNDIQ